MVLISIHPFALRRLFLIVLVLFGFSALCFADPVLMARRYSDEKPSNPKTPNVAQLAKPVRSVDVDPAEFAWTVPGKNASGLALSLRFADEGSRDFSADALLTIGHHTLFLTANTD